MECASVLRQSGSKLPHSKDRSFRIRRFRKYAELLCSQFVRVFFEFGGQRGGCRFFRFRILRRGGSFIRSLFKLSVKLALALLFFLLLLCEFSLSLLELVVGSCQNIPFRKLLSSPCARAPRWASAVILCLNGLRPIVAQRGRPMERASACLKLGCRHRDRAIDLNGLSLYIVTMPRRSC